MLYTNSHHYVYEAGVAFKHQAHGIFSIFKDEHKDFHGYLYVERQEVVRYLNNKNVKVVVMEEDGEVTLSNFELS